ncbi:MAG TPA: alpha/beta hydrolase [Bryobacteraceae bacterium]|nr:alpha/beta hydrolase [Bryobacteraceae bacterium]
MKLALRITLLAAAAQIAVCQNTSFSAVVTGSGKPMILIPGLECPGAVWNGTVEHFRDRYQLHVLTLAGFAGQPAVAGLRLPAVRDDLIRYIRDQRLDRPVLVGHSLGGFLALWVAATVPDLASRVISVDGVPFLPSLFNPAVQPGESREQAERMRKLYAPLAPSQLEAMSRMALTQMISDPKNIEMAAAWASQSDSAFVGQAIYDLMTTDLRPEVSRITAPLLLIVAGKGASPQARAAYEDQVAKAPDHRVVVADGALHFVMLDDPSFLHGAMDRFLAEGGRHER